MIIVVLSEIESIQLISQVGFPGNYSNQLVTEANWSDKHKTLNRRMIQLWDAGMHAWYWFDLTCARMIFSKLSSWMAAYSIKTMFYSTCGQSSFPGKWSKSTHGSITYPGIASIQPMTQAASENIDFYQLMTQAENYSIRINSWINSESYPGLQAIQGQCQSGQYMLGWIRGRAGRLRFDAWYSARACVEEPGCMQDRFRASLGQGWRARPE